MGDDLGEIGDDRIVGIHDERRVARKLPHRVAPALGNELELAVAIELVAEEIREETTRGARAIVSGSAASSTSKSRAWHRRQ